MKRQRGVALILAIGVLAVLTMIATTFALNMRLEYKVAVNYYNGVRARYAADAALQKAIAELREYVKTHAFDSLASSSSTVTTLEGEVHSASAVIEDEQGKLNINNCSIGVFEDLIDTLVTKKSYHNLSTNDAGTIMALKPASGFSTLQDIIARAKNADENFDEEKIILLKPYITTLSYEDPNNSDRSPINVNTTDRALIAAVLMTDSGLNMDPAWSVAGEIVGSELTNWNEFNNTIDGMIRDADNPDGYITEAQATNIKNNVNPNRNTGTTKFCFHPGGYYNIIATGTVYDGAGNPLATETLSAIARINEIYIETTKEQFEQGTPVRVTWLDSCPVNSVALYGSYSISDAQTIPGSIKLGFWDDFDSFDAGYPQSTWTAKSGTFEISNADNADSDLEITDVNINSWGKYVPYDAETGWSWGDFSLRLFEYDVQAGFQMRNVGWVLFRGITTGNPVALHAKEGELAWGNAWAYEVPYNSGTGDIELLSDSDAIAKGYDPPSDYKYSYPAQVRMWPGSNNDQDAYRTPLTYNDKKTYNIVASGSTVTTAVYTSSNSASLIRTDMSTSSGKIGLYGDGVKVAWDDIRIISPNGNFTSQIISPTGGVVEWGTITATVTIPQTADVASETIALKTKTNNDSDWQDPSGEQIISASSQGTSIQYKVFFATADANIQETSVLEDTTITYLPETVVRYYTIFQ